MFKKALIAAVAAALCGTAGVTLAAKGGNGGGIGNGIGGGQAHVNVNSNAPATLDHDRGQVRAAERHSLHAAPALPRVKPNRVQTSSTTKITPHKVSSRTTANTRYHSKVRHNPIPRVNDAPDFRASAK